MGGAVTDEKEVSRQLQWQRRNEAMGLCVICGKEPIHRAKRCEVHWEKNREAARLRYEKRVSERKLAQEENQQ